MPAAATSEGSPAGSAEDGQGKAVMTRVVEPSVEKGKSSAAAETAPSEAAAVDPLGEALAALDRRDYATAQRLFEALGRKDAAAAIANALAALDRKDYATAQGLFEALGKTGPGGALASGWGRAAAATAKKAASMLGPISFWSPRQGATETSNNAARSHSASRCGVPPVSAAGKEGESARSEDAFPPNRLGAVCGLRRI